MRDDFCASFSSAMEEELLAICTPEAEPPNEGTINVLKSPPLQPPSALTVETSMNSTSSKKSRKRETSGGKNKFVDEFL